MFLMRELFVSCLLNVSYGFCETVQEVKREVVHSLEGSWCSQEKAELLIDLVVANRPRVCVEIGAYTGSSVLPVLAALKYVGEGKIYAIDAWSNREAVKYLAIHDSHYQWWSRVDMEGAKNQFINRISEWDGWSYCQVIHLPAGLAVRQIPETIDLLHLDGSFSEQGSLLDVELFLPKVRSGGYILLSNVYVSVDGSFSKMASMWRLYDDCELICEIDNRHTALFRKN